MDYNHVVVVGNLTRDPELKSLPSGISVCNIAVATNRKWTNKDTNEQQQETEFHNVVIFGKMADTVAQYMSKGNKVLVEGRLKTSSWEADGVKKYRTEIIAELVQFGPKPGGSTQASDSASKPAPTQPQEEEINIENIPF